MTLFDLATLVVQQMSISRRNTTAQNVTKQTASLYHIRTVCRRNDVKHVELLLRRSLTMDCGVIESFDCASQNESDIAVFDVDVRRADNVRLNMVRVVSRLGMEPSVRSVSWNAVLKSVA
ncbi:hypothetical protein [Undibacterium sp. RuRC25W]|uniref:hypothetical protein n=1 Tax=Undibacterium sp. RuRC25W TaxID=3413047 RepID=UPI003BF31ABE